MSLSTNKNQFGAFGAGSLVGVLGGLIGLGGAEFRLPLLISVFSFIALEAVIVNKAISLVVVSTALLFRTSSVSVAEVLAHAHVIVILLSGSVLGAWVGASIATRLKDAALYRVIALCLVIIAAVLLFAHDVTTAAPLLDGIPQVIAGVACGLAIGAVASLLGVAGGELLIPTIILLFGIDIKLAGSLSLAVSLPTMLVGFARYSRDGSFAVLRRHPTFLLWMAAGSIAGAFVGALLLPVVSGKVLLPMLAAILVLSAFKIWRHDLKEKRR